MFLGDLSGFLSKRSNGQNCNLDENERNSQNGRRFMTLKEQEAIIQSPKQTKNFLKNIYLSKTHFKIEKNSTVSLIEESISEPVSLLRQIHKFRSG